MIWDVLRVMLFAYGMLAVALNGINLRAIRRYGEAVRYRNGARATVVLVGFACIGIVETVGRLGDPLTWRLPALFVCFSAYLWTQLALLAELRRCRTEAITQEAIQVAEVAALQGLEQEPRQ